MSDFVTVPRKDWLELKRLVKQALVSQEQWITEQETCQLLGIKKTTLIGYVSKGRITPDMYRVGVGGTRFYNKEKIMGQPLVL
jgi:predicted DNA-binding transcriptional regulator AlpA